MNSTIGPDESGRKDNLDITPSQYRELEQLLQQHLPDVVVWAYGSRVTFKARPASDLDLVVFASDKQRRGVSDLRDALDESDLPFNVDVMVWDTMPEYFKPNIEQSYYIVQGHEETTEQRQWRNAKLRDICNKIVDCPHSTPKWIDDGVFVIKSQNVRNGRLNQSIKNFTDEETYEQRSKRIRLRANDIIVTREAPMGEVCILPPNFKCCLGQRMVALRANESIVVPKYLLFAMQSKQVQHQISFNEGTGSTVSNMRIPALEVLEIPIPDIQSQKAIAHILGSLDDKIELNQKTNQVLEDIAKAIFKSWFIDFDPVRAKTEGRPTGLPSEIGDLFPDEFVESEIGKTPKGWESGVIEDLVSFQGGYAFDSKDWSLNGTIPVIKIRNVKRLLVNCNDCSMVDESTVTGLERFALQRGDILIGMTGYVGEIGIVPKRKVMPYFNQRVGKISPTCEFDRSYILLYCCSTTFKELVQNKATGSAQANVSGKDIQNLPLLLSTKKLRHAFHRSVSDLYEKILVNEEENQLLSNLRDTLLPKLISGELHIRDAEKFLEKAGI